MSMAAVHGSSPVPVVTHAAGTAALEDKVTVRNLNFYYGGNRALKDINVSLYAKRVTAFIGPSGCGKSTLLRILNRVYDLYPNQRADGEVLLDGKNILAPEQDHKRERTEPADGDIRKDDPMSQAVPWLVLCAVLLPT